ncbi:MAG: ATP-binding protein [Hydrogenophaga sp.]|uniref:ATP-binding protein n=1 Tax=Hydrogenophaga sp. TaxID=1904254 RepID=UPI0026107525|nr:ATP-binding protein [Hydrogenophaga sp.]MDM7942113.1 ATP-binding protein [Hydrogenophaga sp.]
MDHSYTAVISQKVVDSQATALPKLTRRDVWLPAVQPKKATAVIGMRRAGKTSFLWQLMAERHAAGTPREGLLYFSFEDERLAGLRLQDLEQLVETYYRLNPEWRDQRRASFFLDEVQLIPGWEGFARRLLDSENIELFLSGSSARMLSREVATSMRGRALEAVVSPFSFREALRHAGHEPAKSTQRLTKAERSQLDHHLLSYLTVGGFAEAQGLGIRDHQALMRNYVDVVLLRDVIERHNLTQPQVLRWMVQQLLGNAAGAFSINKFHADLKSRGVPVGKDTLHDMLANLEDAFLLCSVGIATSSPRQRQVNPRKVYPVDTGLMGMFALSGKANTGHALETVVLHSLQAAGADVAYVRSPTGYEVDFYARHPGGQELLVQVCADISQPDTLAREVRALQEAAPLWPQAQCQLVALHVPSQIAVPDGITLCPATDWLLGMGGER